MKPKIKICGITSLADAQMAVELGADLLGFNFYAPSPRYIEPAKAAEIIDMLCGQVVNVGLFVNAGTERIAQVLRECPLDVVQLHGDESNDDCQVVKQLGPQVFKAIRVRQKEDVVQGEKYDVSAILLDAFHKDLYGGSGATFNWDWLNEGLSQKIYLAGGITPDNITQAMAAGTYGIDLCSGVEKEPGIKDEKKMRALFRLIKSNEAMP
ncbi:MAG: phosphoribosylanthranilate isomerase [Phycisphaerae bacterium]|nr:phosphoribosylanthranilate isomerase [Phycisphaerae bacterium]